MQRGVEEMAGICVGLERGAAGLGIAQVDGNELGGAAEVGLAARQPDHAVAGCSEMFDGGASDDPERSGHDDLAPAGLLAADLAPGPGRHLIAVPSLH